MVRFALAIGLLFTSMTGYAERGLCRIWRTDDAGNPIRILSRYFNGNRQSNAANCRDLCAQHNGEVASVYYGTDWDFTIIDPCQ